MIIRFLGSYCMGKLAGINNFKVFICKRKTLNVKTIYTIAVNLIYGPVICCRIDFFIPQSLLFFDLIILQKSFFIGEDHAFKTVEFGFFNYISNTDSLSGVNIEI